MKTIILAGGFGSRLAEETVLRPKPMVEIGGKPILWHIMNIYASHGYTEFGIACGYKGGMIKEYFRNFYYHNSDLMVNLKDGSYATLNSNSPGWHVSLIDTGLKTQTGGRLLRLKKWLGEETFMLTYGDGVSNVDIQKLVEFHRSHGKLATVTAVRPPARFGALGLDGDNIARFSEKPQAEEGWINGGFFVFEPGVFAYLSDDDTVLERGPLEQLADAEQLMACRHTGFWQPMDTLRDKELLEALWASGKAPWMVCE